MTARTVMQPADIRRALIRISHEILESLHSSPGPDAPELVILGIPTRGVVLARRIGALWRKSTARQAAIDALCKVVVEHAL